MLFRYFLPDISLSFLFDSNLLNCWNWENLCHLIFWQIIIFCAWYTFYIRFINVQSSFSLLGTKLFFFCCSKFINYIMKKISALGTTCFFCNQLKKISVLGSLLQSWLADFFRQLSVQKIQCQFWPKSVILLEIHLFYGSDKAIYYKILAQCRWMIYLIDMKFSEWSKLTYFSFSLNPRVLIYPLP